MKNLLIINCCLAGVALSTVANAQNRYKKPPAKPVGIESFVFYKDLWKTKIADFAKDPKNKKFNFKWQSSSKKGLRSAGVGFKMLEIKAGECVIISDGGKEIKGISLSFYNKGDDGLMSAEKFTHLADNIKNKVTGKLSTQPRSGQKKGAVNIKQDAWVQEGTSYQLERSVAKDGRPEFLRFRIMSAKTATRGESTTNRSELRANVVRDKESGDVYIDNVPMVDQGRKGYCACASAARVYQYYGRTTDQHEIAQIAGSSAHGGTSIAEMVGALKKVTKHLNSRVNILYEYPKGLADSGDFDSRAYRTYMSGKKEMLRDFNSYQQLAKKANAKSIPMKGEKPYSRISSKEAGYINFRYFTQECEPKIYREVMMKKSSFSRFKGKIKEYIDQGVPVGWCLQLGLFPEKGLPQGGGGHMRLIIGYNDKKKELIYTDSWGKGHAKKNMDAGEAFCMTNVILVLPPTK